MASSLATGLRVFAGPALIAVVFPRLEAKPIGLLPHVQARMILSFDFNPDQAAGIVERGGQTRQDGRRPGCRPDPAGHTQGACGANHRGPLDRTSNCSSSRAADWSLQRTTSCGSRRPGRSCTDMPTLTPRRSEWDSAAKPPDMLNTNQELKAANKGSRALGRDLRSLRRCGRRQRMMTSTFVYVTGLRLCGVKKGDAIGQIWLTLPLDGGDDVLSDGLYLLRVGEKRRLAPRAWFRGPCWSGHSIAERRPRYRSRARSMASLFQDDRISRSP